MNKQTYTDYDRERAVAAWVAEGTYSEAARLTGIPESTIRTWRNERPDWWQRVEEREREAFEEEQRAVFNELRMKSAQAVLERLEKGDERIVQGKKVRVKVSARDAATIYGISTDKMRVSLGKPTTIRETDSTADKLRHLREAANQSEAKKRGIESGQVTEIKPNG